MSCVASNAILSSTWLSCGTCAPSLQSSLFQNTCRSYPTLLCLISQRAKTVACYNLMTNYQNLHLKHLLLVLWT
ncbi:hypothetical protein FOCC_FOCC016010 [Frankliniella occidentalis]|nr:hypothetical protein FOCC_FOCC016010 [Frankliniella occidentalis]